jgi:hypothetical protein
VALTRQRACKFRAASQRSTRTGETPLEVNIGFHRLLSPPQGQPMGLVMCVTEA